MIIEISKLLEHEKINTKQLKELKKEIKLAGIFTMPIAVDKNTNIILDGHHRLHSLKELGYTKIPVIFVDYNNPGIEVQSWKGGVKVTKDAIIKSGLTGKKLPSKTTKHMILVNGELEHISIIQKKINIPLNLLK